MLTFTVSPLELMLCGTLMYWFLFGVFRFILRRDVGSLGINDFLFCGAQAGERDRALRGAWRGRSKHAQCCKTGR